MTSVERSQRRKFSKIILEENFTFRTVAGCCVVLLKQFGADIVRQLNMDTGLYTAQNPYHPNARLPIPQAEMGEKSPSGLNLQIRGVRKGDSPEAGLVVVEKWSHFQDPYKITKVLEYGVGIGLKNPFSTEIFVCYLKNFLGNFKS